MQFTGCMKRATNPNCLVHLFVVGSGDTGEEGGVATELGEVRTKRAFVPHLLPGYCQENYVKLLYILQEQATVH